MASEVLKAPIGARKIFDKMTEQFLCLFVAKIQQS